jgi:tRNA dimethylallyltransferase
VAGRQFAPFQPDSGLRPQLQARARQEGLPALYAQLVQVDPDAAGSIHPNDEKRIIRALEVFLSTGKPLSQHDRESRALPSRYTPLTIVLNFAQRPHLWERIDRRVDQMMAQGLEGEVRALLESGIPPDCTAMQAIGYKELAAAIRSGLPVQSGAEEVKLRSRQYAKRQLTWFRRSRDARWFEWEKIPDFSAALSFSTELIREAGLQ